MLLVNPGAFCRNKMGTEEEEENVFMLSLRKKGADIGHSSSPGLEVYLLMRTSKLQDK